MEEDILHSHCERSTLSQGSLCKYTTPNTQTRGWRPQVREHLGVVFNVVPMCPQERLASKRGSL
jgi:hypothetical protein